MKRVLVTGATGFVGRAVCAALEKSGMEVRAAVRQLQPSSPASDVAVIGSIDGNTDWEKVLDGIDGIVHLAARTHIVRETAEDPFAAFRRTNVDGTRRLAEQALDAGVRRFVHISSIHADPVCGRNTPYGRSKAESERALAETLSGNRMEHVILRPPLVYGPGVKANMLQLLRLCARTIPLPFASLTSPRDMIGRDNLADLVLRCLTHENAAGRTYGVCDGAPLSLAGLARLLRTLMGRPARLFPCPPSLILAAAALAGKRPQLAAAIEPLSIDSSPLRTDLGWHPPVPLEEEMTRMVTWFLSKPAAQHFS